MRSGCPPDEWKIVPLGNEPREVFVSPDPESVALSNPSLVALPGGRLVVAMDQAGPGVKRLQGPKGRDVLSHHWVQGRILTSNDQGASWQLRAQFPFSHPCLFRDGASLYCLGHRGTLQIMKSSDGGATWSGVVALSATAGGETGYVHSPCRALVAGERVYLAVLKLPSTDIKGDPSGLLAMEIWLARQGADLTDNRSWTAGAPTPPFHAFVPLDRLELTGAPFYDCPDPARGRDVGGRRWAGPPGWMEPHVVPLPDPDHVLHEAGAANLFVLTAVRLHRANLGLLLPLEDRDGHPAPAFQKAPSRRMFSVIQLPGGHRKFDILYDDVSRRYWLVGNRASDSMRRPDRLPPSRPGLPEDEAGALQLHTSTNLVDWDFAGLIEQAGPGRQALVSPSIAIRGGDLCVVCGVVGDERRRSRDTDRTLLFQIPGFRDLAY